MTSSTSISESKRETVIKDHDLMDLSVSNACETNGNIFSEDPYSVSFYLSHIKEFWLKFILFASYERCIQTHSAKRIYNAWEFINPSEWNYRLSPKKITIGIWVSIAKEPFMESEKSNQIMKLWLFFYNSVKTPSDLAKKWSQRNMDFCKASHRSLSSKFCHMNVCGFHRQIVFIKDRLANMFKFHAYIPF